MIFVNLVDFDTQYGHRNDLAGYAANLERFDARLAQVLPLLRDTDLLIVTADHGNDPATPSTDHSREHVRSSSRARRSRRVLIPHSRNLRGRRADGGRGLRSRANEGRRELSSRTCWPADAGYWRFALLAGFAGYSQAALATGAARTTHYAPRTGHQEHRSTRAHQRTRAIECFVGMASIREQLEALESEMLAPQASRSRE